MREEISIALGRPGPEVAVTPCEHRLLAFDFRSHLPLNANLDNFLSRERHSPNNGTLADMNTQSHLLPAEPMSR
ncbi:hypothetical protein J6590_018489 [Homalodisca vitripennis]|nr:hypothetical protein J6590_018489 [Homalodisca vitripennis]